MIPNYTFIGEMSGLALLARILYCHDYKPFTDLIMSVPNLMEFIEAADFLGINNIEEITECIITSSGKYLEELEN